MNAAHLLIPFTSLFACLPDLLLLLLLLPPPPLLLLLLLPP